MRRWEFLHVPDWAIAWTPASWRCAVILASLFLPSPARSDAVADFYRGRQINFVVGFGTGGGYDVYARLLARHLGRYIPGNPSIVVQNMPGAASLRAVNYLYNVAPKDGTVIGSFGRDMALIGVLGSQTARFDPRKLNWLGSSSSYANDAYLLFARRDAKVQSIEDARKPGGAPLVLGATGEGGTSSDVTTVLRDALGLKLKTVTGYPDSNALFLAVDRKEVDGRTAGFSAVQSSHAEWLRPDANVRALLQFARVTRHQAFPDVPTARELANGDAARALIEFAEIPYALSRPFAAPPGVPPERAAALQTAFLKVHRDAQFRDEAGRLQIDLSPIGGDEALAVVTRIATASPEVIEYERRLLAGAKE